MKIEKGSGALYVLPRNVRGVGVDLNDLTEGKVPSAASANAELRDGDILINLRGSENVAAVMPATEGRSPIYATLDIGVVRPDPDRADPNFLAAWLNLPATQAALSVDREGSRIPRLSLRALSAVDVPLPAIERQVHLGALHAEIGREHALRTQITEARQRLLTELLRHAAEEPAPSE